jgi:hypothetical protein
MYRQHAGSLITMSRVLRYLSVVGLAFWPGGIAFYGAIVIPKAHAILDSHREIGFVTREVTASTNGIGGAVLAVLLVNFAVSWRSLDRSGRIVMATSLGVMVAAQIVLFLLRAHLDSMLDPAAMKILDRPRFMPLHERYLNVTSVLCMAALAHLWLLLADRPRPGPPLLPAA